MRPVVFGASILAPENRAVTALTLRFFWSERFGAIDFYLFCVEVAIERLKTFKLINNAT